VSDLRLRNLVDDRGGVELVESDGFHGGRSFRSKAGSSKAVKSSKSGGLVAEE
jgi:hypothetical protein